MRTLDVFRTSVAAAALGFARRAFDEAMARATSRKMFGGVLADFQLTQAKLAQMATDDRQRRAPHLPRRLAARPGRERDARGGDGQARRDRRRAAGDRRGGADVGRARRAERRAGRAALPRDPRAAHLRRRERGAAADHRPRPAQGARPGDEGQAHEERSAPPRRLAAAQGLRQRRRRDRPPGCSSPARSAGRPEGVFDERRLRGADAPGAREHRRRAARRRRASPSTSCA